MTIPLQTRRNRRPTSGHQCRAADWFTHHPPCARMGEGLPSFSRAAPETAESSSAGSGDSKVVDAEGKPLVVYHGTASDIAGV